MHDDVLASDAEREAAAAELRTHLADGRLTTDEFGARIDAVYAARTRGEVAATLARLPQRQVAEPQPPRTSLVVLALRQAALSSTAVVVCILVWAFTGMHGDFWPKWVILAVLVGLVTRVGKAAAGHEEARARLERRS